MAAGREERTVTEAQPARSVNKHPLVWFQIPVADFERASRFYGQVFKWESRPMPGTKVWEIDAGDGIGGGFIQGTPRETPDEGLTFYVRVPDLEQTIVRAVKAGATLLRRPEYLGGRLGISAAIRDPDGNVIGLWSEN